MGTIYFTLSLSLSPSAVCLEFLPWALGKIMAFSSASDNCGIVFPLSEGSFWWFLFLVWERTLKRGKIAVSFAWNNLFSPFFRSLSGISGHRRFASSKLRKLANWVCFRSGDPNHSHQKITVWTILKWVWMTRQTCRAGQKVIWHPSLNLKLDFGVTYAAVNSSIALLCIRNFQKGMSDAGNVLPAIKP